MPKRFDQTSLPEPLLSVAEMAAVDAAAVSSGISIDSLMLAAGAAVVDATPDGAAVTVLCGPGNNGGDGYVAARLLRARGRTVEIFADRRPAGDTAAARAATQWAGPIGALADFRPSGDRIVIDALYGAGLSRPITGATADAIARLNASDAKVIAVDVPSGLDGDSGQITGPAATASRTVTFFRAKPGHYIWPGRGLCGELIVADIGLAAAHLAEIDPPSIFLNAPPLWLNAAPMISEDAHKYRRGHCLVISGSELQTGASRLCAKAALNTGAGAVSLAGDRDALRIHAAQVSAIMLKEAASASDLGTLLASTRFAAAIIGPAAGVSPKTNHMINVLLASGIPLVLDADALTCMVGQLGKLAHRPGAASLVLTPHAGEFERLFADQLVRDPVYASLAPSRQASKVEKARAAARLTGATIVFKGIDTVIADASGRAAINANGGPELATAGSGDVLAGLIGAHLAQGMPAFEAAASAVWLHGSCGAAYGIGLTAERLVDIIRPLAALASPQRNAHRG